MNTALEKWQRFQDLLISNFIQKRRGNYRDPKPFLNKQKRLQNILMTVIYCGNPTTERTLSLTRRQRNMLKLTHLTLLMSELWAAMKNERTNERKYYTEITSWYCLTGTWSRVLTVNKITRKDKTNYAAQRQEQDAQTDPAMEVKQEYTMGPWRPKNYEFNSCTTVNTDVQNWWIDDTQIEKPHRKGWLNLVKIQ